MNYESIWRSTISPIMFTPKSKREDEQVPIPQKMTLTIKEAAAYSGIGINKLYDLLNTPNCPFVLFVGTRKLVKRRLFEEFIEQHMEI